jgi:hypothetical protein
MNIKVTLALCISGLTMLSGCTSDDYPEPRDYSHRYDDAGEQREYSREAWRRREARREEMNRRDEAAYRQAEDRRRFCRIEPSSIFCRDE